MIKIKAENVCKKFLMEAEKSQGALFGVLSLFSKKNKKELIVIENVSFDVVSGQILGIIGKNGSGKSTLLRIIAGIYPKDSGRIELCGDSIYLNGFSSGLSPKLTMKENIYLMGSVMGLSGKEVKEKFGQIVDFSGLGDFINNKVYQFSTGMTARLVFSIVINCLEYKNPDIILLDEVFEAGGDCDFKASALEKMESFIKGNKAVILVSHDLGILKKYCNNVLWLECGKIKKIGNPEEVIKEYENSSNLLY